MSDKNSFSFTETDKYEIWQRFWHLKQERCEELNELITEAIKWLKKSKEAELDLAKHDHNAEDQFAKLHRIRHSQVTVNAVCGCGRAVEAKKSFEKINYSNSSERKLRNILGTIRTQLRDNVALTKARASEALSSLRFKIELRSYDQLEMGMFWVWLNTLAHHAVQLEAVGLAESCQFWISRLVKQHRLHFSTYDELRLLDLIVGLPPTWIAKWLHRLVKVQHPIPNLESIRDFMFYVEMATCSVSEKLIEDIKEVPEAKTFENLQEGAEENLHGTSSNPIDVQNSSPNSSEFSLISDFELMGGMERDSNARLALLSPSDLNALILQLNLSHVSSQFYSEQSNMENFPHFITSIIELLSNAIKIHSYSTLFQNSIQILSNEMAKLLRLQFSLYGPSDGPMSEIVLRYLSISRLGILSNMMKMPFEQVEDVRPFIGHFFFMSIDEGTDPSDINLDDAAFKFAENRIATLSHSDLIDYLKSVASFIRKRKHEDLDFINPLFSLLYRVCIKLPATYHQIDDSTRMEIFRIILNTHASLFSTLLVFASESIFEYGEIIINLINGIRLTSWVPAQHDIALLQDWLLNECHTSVPSRLAQSVIQNMNWGYCDESKPSIPLVIHQKIANILIRQTLEVTKPKNGSIKDTLGLNKAKLDHITYLHTQLSRLLLNPLFRKSTSGPDPEFHEPELLEAHSNPLLGPAVLNSSVPSCAYLLATMLDSRDSDPNSRIEKLVETGLICIHQPGATILAVRCLEICFKIMESQSDEKISEKSLSQIAQLIEKVLYCDPNNLMHLFCFLVNSFPKISCSVLKICFLTSDWTRASVLQLLEKCLFHAWSCLKTGKDSGVEQFTEVETTFRICLLGWLHGRRNREIKSNEPSNSRWQNLTAVFAKAIKPTHDDLGESFPSTVPPLVKFQFYRALDEIIMNDSDWMIQKEIKSLLSSNPAMIINQAFDEAKTKFNINSTYVSLPIYKLGQMLLDSRFDSPILLLLTHQFFLCFLHETDGVSLGHKYYEKHPHIDFLAKLRRRLVELSEFFTDSSAQVPPCVGVSDSTIASLFWTAALWLEEPRVHDRQEELQYLPPQYGPNLLVEIRSGKFGDWLTLSRFGFEEQINKSKEEWRKRYEVKYVPLLEHCSLGEEELAELDLGPANDLFNDEIIEIDNKGEMPGLDFLLNCDIRMFCSPLISEFISTADWQLCCAEQLTQLDISYCDLLPDLYKNLPQVIEVEASCSSGFRGHTCQAPAKVPVEIEIRTKMNEIGNILAANRQKYLEIRTNWVNPNRWSSLGTSSFKLNHIADQLETTFRTAILEEERQMAQRQGEAMFYALVGSVTPSVTSFPPCARIAIGLVEKLALVFCSQSASFQHLDTCIRFPSLASILAPHFLPQTDSPDFVQMYSIVIERLNKGHTTLAFSLLSKFQVFEFASSCSEEHLQELIFSLKSGFFALSGDNSGENNLDFDLPDSNDSTDLVKAILAKQTCDIIRARPDESARDILQTLLQISSVGDGVNAVWDRIKEAFIGLSEANVELECGEDIINLISNHFLTIRHNEDLFAGPIWPTILPQIATIMTVVLNMKKPYDHSTSEDVRSLSEATFIAVEPFLQPIKKHDKLIWPHGPAVEIFLNVLLERYKVLNQFDPAATQRNFSLFHLQMTIPDESAVKMPKEYFFDNLKFINEMEIGELIPTEELNELFIQIFSYKSPLLNEMISNIILASDWAMLFTLSPSFSPIPVLLRTILFISGEDYQIHKVETFNATILEWLDFGTHNLSWISNSELVGIFNDISPNLNLDSFIHPTSCHVACLKFIQEICSCGRENTIDEDLARRRIWIGALSRLLRRSNIETYGDVLKSRISPFLEYQLSWVLDEVTAETPEDQIIPIWGDLFQILNTNSEFLDYFLRVVKDEKLLERLRLFIGTSSRILRNPICQLVMIECAIEKSFELGHGLSLLHGTLCSLPIYIRNEFHDCLNQTESLLCPLLLLQEQLRSTLPAISKIKLVQQNTHLIRNVKLENLESEWKLVIYLHQIIRLTMALWKDDTLDKDSFGVLQVFLHNELKPILNYLFDQKPSSLLLSMVGMSSKTPSPSFQLLVKAFLLLISNVSKGEINREEIQNFQDLDSSDSRFRNLEDFIHHLGDLIEFNSIDNIDEMVRIWSRLNDKQYSIFYLENP